MKIVLKKVDRLKEFAEKGYLNANEGIVLDVDFTDFIKIIEESVGEFGGVATFENGIQMFFEHQEKESLGEEDFENFNFKIGDEMFVFGDCIFANISEDDELLSLTDKQLKFLSEIEVLRKTWKVSCELYSSEGSVSSEIFEVESLKPSDALFMAGDLLESKFDTFELVNCGMMVGSEGRDVEYFDKATSKYIKGILKIID